MTAIKKLKMAMTALDINQRELATRVNQSPANLSKKLVADNLRINEYATLVEALGCKLEIIITLPDGTIL
jgi:DNA-binding Xre family transcriptional regulator